MIRLQVYLVVLVLAFIFVGCATDAETQATTTTATDLGVVIFPDALLGTWKEVDYERGIIFKENGDFEFVDIDYVDADNPINTIIGGTGIWSVSGSELKMELISGHMNWLGHTVTSPSVLTWKYVISGITLTITETSGDESVTYGMDYR